MARMPQIPQPEIGNRPDSRIGLSTPANPEEAGKALSEGAVGASKMGDTLERLEAQRDAALAKVQDVKDEATALASVGDFTDKSKTALAQMQAQFKDDPQKAVDAYNQHVGDLVDDMVQQAPTAGAALKMLPELTRKTNELRASNENWALQQGIQNSKNQLAQADADATHNLESVVNSAHLQSIINAHLSKTDKVRSQVTRDGDASESKQAGLMMEGWVAQRSAVSPIAALGVVKELQDPNSAAYKMLDADTRQRGVKQAMASYEGAQKTAGIGALAAHHQTFNGLTDLISANDPGFPAAAYAKRQQVLEGMKAGAENPGLDAKTKETIKKEGELMLTGIDHLDDMFRKQRGIDQKAVDQKVREDLLGRNTKLFTKLPTSVNSHLTDALRLRQDNIKAFAEGHTSWQTYELVENGLKKSMTARDAAEAKNIGKVGWAFNKQSPRQAGNYKLNELFDGGIYKKATPEQKNDAREAYIQQLYDAETSGTNVDEAAALTMATRAAKKAMGF